MDNDSNTNNDNRRIKNIKKIFFDTAYKNHLGHLPSALSSMEILYTLYNKAANITKENVSALNRDRVIISKEHCRFAQICVLYEKGLVSKKVLDTYMTNGAPAGHDMYNFVGSDDIAAVDIASGSLGHGIGLSIGFALANPIDNIYVIVGDGELQEGSCWESIMFIGHNNIKNVTIIVDRNNQQIDNLTKNIINSSKFAPDAIKAFDFDVIECYGHSISELETALNKKSDKPKCIIANTIKGKEIIKNRDKYGFAVYHWTTMNEEEYKSAIQEVENAAN